MQENRRDAQRPGFLVSLLRSSLILSALDRFTAWIYDLLKNGLFVEYLRTFLEYKERIPEDADGADPGTEIQSIEFKNVSFSYKDKEVIKNLSMEFRGGKTYALVGHNGAGKTTLIKLLLRFYDPTEGQILLNGRDIREYNLRKYRALFATAFQDHRMFSMTVAENVIMGENVPAEEREEKVNEALRLAMSLFTHSACDSLRKSIRPF